MTTVLPSLTRTIDDDFTNTWYEIRSFVVDNVMESTILWAALNSYGCLVPQVGGEYVTRTVGYGKKSTQRFGAGSVLEQNTPKLDTMGIWNWRFFLVDVTRSMIDDAKNAGEFRIKDYLVRRLGNARDSIVQDIEMYGLQWGAYYDPTEDPQMNGIYDICPNYTAESAVGSGSASDSQASGTSNGGIDRAGNAWWRNWVAYSGASQANATFIAGATNAPYAIGLVPDMRHMWNCISANKESPNLILTNQLMYESYEDEAADKQQIVQNAFTRTAVDLGFDEITFKGATFSYSSDITELHMFMLNMNHIEVVYDPEMWFDMTEWKSTSGQLERVAYICCMTTGLITDQPRRHGVMEYAS